MLKLVKFLWTCLKWILGIKLVKAVIKTAVKVKQSPLVTKVLPDYNLIPDQPRRRLLGRVIRRIRRK